MRQGSLRYLLGGAGFLTLRWWEWGPVDGPVVVCVHGLTRCGRDFQHLAEALAAEGRRVMAPDLPGRGASDRLPDSALYIPGSYANALTHLLARLDGPIDWVGTSLGAVLGLMIAALPGAPIRRMVLNDTGFHVAQPAIARIHDYLRAMPGLLPDVAAVEAHLRDVHAPFGPLTEDQWRHLAEISCVPAEGGMRLHYDPALAEPILAAKPEALDLRALWDAVGLPMLVLRGAESDLLLAETAAAMATRPGVDVVTWPGIGHAPALMDPEQIETVARFLR